MPSGEAASCSSSRRDARGSVADVTMNSRGARSFSRTWDSKRASAPLLWTLLDVFERETRGAPKVMALTDASMMLSRELIMDSKTADAMEPPREWPQRITR